MKQRYRDAVLHVFPTAMLVYRKATALPADHSLVNAAGSITAQALH